MNEDISALDRIEARDQAGEDIDGQEFFVDFFDNDEKTDVRNCAPLRFPMLAMVVRLLSVAGRGRRFRKQAQGGELAPQSDAVHSKDLGGA